jgi:hypothetical protein
MDNAAMYVQLRYARHQRGAREDDVILYRSPYSFIGRDGTQSGSLGNLEGIPREDIHATIAMALLAFQASKG